METLLAERADGRHYWQMSCDYLHRDHVTVNGRVLLGTSALAADTFEILADGLAEISGLNVETGEYRVIKRDGVILRSGSRRIRRRPACGGRQPGGGAILTMPDDSSPI